MHKTYKTYKTYKMMIGASCDTPWVCFSAVWFGSGRKFTAGENKTNPAARLEESAAADTGKSVRDF